MHTVIISASGIDGIKIVGKSEVELDPASTDTKIVRVRVDPQKAKAAGVGADGTPIVFHLKSPETGEDLEYKSIYYYRKSKHSPYTTAIMAVVFIGDCLGLIMQKFKQLNLGTNNFGHG